MKMKYVHSHWSLYEVYLFNGSINQIYQPISLEQGSIRYILTCKLDQSLHVYLSTVTKSFSVGCGRVPRKKRWVAKCLWCAFIWRICLPFFNLPHLLFHFESKPPHAVGGIFKWSPKIKSTDFQLLYFFLHMHTHSLSAHWDWWELLLFSTALGWNGERESMVIWRMKEIKQDKNCKNTANTTYNTKRKRIWNRDAIFKFSVSTF